jgi:hypothetical protein
VIDVATNAAAVLQANVRQTAEEPSLSLSHERLNESYSTRNTPAYLPLVNEENSFETETEKLHARGVAS